MTPRQPAGPRGEQSEMFDAQPPSNPPMWGKMTQDEAAYVERQLAITREQRRRAIVRLTEHDRRQFAAIRAGTGPVPNDLKCARCDKNLRPTSNAIETPGGALIHSVCRTTPRA